MKLNSLFGILLFVVIIARGYAQQPIDTKFFGQNAWFSFYNFLGSSDDINDYYDEAKLSGAKFIRIGGIDAAIIAPPNLTKLLEMIDNIRAQGMEPILTVPYFNNNNDNTSLNSDVTAFMTNIFLPLQTPGSNYRGITYWEISNEPDNDGTGGLTKTGYGYDGSNTWVADDIKATADYIKAFSVEMKTADNSIKIIGPSHNQYRTAFLNATSGLYNDGSGSGTHDVSGLIPAIFNNPPYYSGFNTGTAVNLPFVDIASFHYYQHKFTPPPPPSLTPRKDVITFNDPSTYLTPGSFRNHLDDIYARYTGVTFLANRMGQPLEIAVTETNVGDNEPSFSFGGNDGRTFLGGQWWAEDLSAGMQHRCNMMQPFSMLENTLGYMDYTGFKRSAYWHYTLMADYFKSGTGYTSVFYPSTIVDGSTPVPSYPDVKSFAAKVNNQVVVVIMNQKNYGGNQPYLVNTSGTATGSTINISFATGGSNYSHSDIINQEESQWLIFNCNGAYEGKWVYNITNNGSNQPPTWVPSGVTPYIAITSDCPPPCYGSSASTGTVTLTSSPTAEYFSWISNQGLTVNNPLTDASSVDLVYQNTAPAGTDTYTYIATAANGCTTTQNQIITNSTGIGFEFYSYLSSFTSSHCGGNNGTATIGTGGCEGLITYAWDNSETSNPAVNLSPGEHTVTVTCYDSPSGIVSQILTVFIPTDYYVSVSAGRDITVCSGSSSGLQALVSSGTNPFSYSWSPSVGLNLTNVSNPTATPSVTTDYSVTVTDANGCTASDVVRVNVNPVPAFTVSGPTTACVAGVFNATPVIANTSYTWTTSTGGSGTGSTALYNFPSSGGTITFKAFSNATGCTYISSLYVGSCCTEAANPNFVNKNSTAMASISVSGVPPYVVNNKTFSINGIFHVNDDLTLQGCDVRMGYLAQIIVDPGKTLTITSNGASDRTHIYSCNEMWDGIYISTSTGAVVVNNGTTIEDALSAVNSENMATVQISSTVAHGPVIFNKNLRGVTIKNGLSGTHPAYVRNATFQCYDGLAGGNPNPTSNNLRYPHTTERSYAGVDISNVLAITIGNPLLPTAVNTFDNLDYGVLSAASSVKVFNGHFQNLLNPNPLGVKGFECTPGTGICATGSKFLNRSLTVGAVSGGNYTNTFTNCSFGINANSHINVTAIKNTFTDVNIGIQAATNYTKTIALNQNTFTGSRTGINLYDNQTSTVTVNDNTMNAGTVLQAVGIVGQEVVSGTAVYTINRNTIQNVRVGVAVSGLKNSTVESNNVYLLHTTVPTQRCFGVRVTNSTQCNITDNWVQGQNSSDYWVEGVSIDISYSNSVTCNESHTVGTGLWFGGVETPNTRVVKNQMDNNFRGMVVNFGEIGLQYTIGSGGGIKPNDNRWTGAFTYHTFSWNSTGANSALYVRPAAGVYHPSPYLAYSFPNPSDVIPLVPTPGLNLLVCPFTIFTGGGAPRALLLQIAGDSIVPLTYVSSTLWMLRQSLYKYLEVDPSLLSSEPMLASFQSFHATDNIGKIESVEQVLSSLGSATPATLASAQSTNSSVTPSTDVETNSKWLNDLLLNNALTSSSYSTGQLIDLRLLAAKCPYNDGPAVFQARVILSQMEDVEYINDCESTPSGIMHMPQSNHQTKTINEFTLYPNPNDGSMNFIYTLNERSQGDFYIYDISGRLITKYSLQSGENNQLLINETQLNNGVYFYKVIVDNELKASDKIVILK